MTRQEVIDKLEAHQHELREMGVVSLALFGSTARGEARDSSDVDLLVELDADRHVGLFGFARIEEHLETLLGVEKVDLVVRRAVYDELKDQIYGEAIPCFSEAGSSP